MWSFSFMNSHAYLNKYKLLFYENFNHIENVVLVEMMNIYWIVIYHVELNPNEYPHALQFL
jgi:hypothetical protein